MSSRFKPEKKVFNKDGQETFAHLHNKPIVTRRDLLSSGLLSFSATMTLPSIFHLLANTDAAFAQEMVCTSGGVSELVPVICLNLSGGAALSANWVPMDQGQQLLPSYNKMGLGATRNLVIEYSMGAPFAGNNVSRLLVGLKANAPTALLTTSFVGVAVRSRDDSNVNKFDISGMVTKAGLAGNFLPNLGSSGTVTGNKNDFAYVKPPTPLAVNRFTDLTSSLGVAASLDQLSLPQKEKLFKMVKNLNESQSRRLASASGGKEMSHLVNCASGSNIDIVAKGSSGVDPLNNAAFSTIWGITAATDKNSQDYVFAAMVYNSLVGNAGMVNLEMGGYDYHNGSRTTGDQRDQQAGVVMGKILESAKILSKKVFLVVTTDGAVSSAVSESSNAPWMSDRGTAGASYMMAFDPVKKPTQTGSQLGYYNIGQGAEESFITGSSPELAAAGIFANYLSFSNQLPRLEKVVPRIFSADQLKSILKIHGA